MEELALGGAMTATEVGELIGETATTCSFQLRQLAKYGFVEETGGGQGGARPWRLASRGCPSPRAGTRRRRSPPMPSCSCSASRQFARYQTWGTTKGSHAPQWRKAAVSQFLLYLTPEG